MNKYLGDLERGITCIWDGQERLQRLVANEDIQRMVRLTLCTDVGRIEKYTIPDNIVSFVYHSSIHLLPGKMLERKKTECFWRILWVIYRTGRQGEMLLERWHHYRIFNIQVKVNPSWLEGRRTDVSGWGHNMCTGGDT